MDRSWPARCLCIAAALYASAARAQGMLDFSLEVESPPDAQCVTVRALQEAIEARIDRLVFLHDQKPSRAIRVSITREVGGGGGWSAQIVMRDERGEVVGERRVSEQATPCSALDEALVVVISTLIGIADPVPERTAVDEPAEEPHEAQPRKEPASQVVPVPADDDDDDRDVHAALRASLAARGELGLLPGVVPGGALAFDVDFGGFRLVVGGTLLPYAWQALGDGAGASFRSAMGELGLCWVAARPLGAMLGFCAGAQAGAITVRTSGLAAQGQHLDPIVRALLGPRLHVPFSARLGVLAGVDAAAPVYAPHYFILEGGEQRRFYHSVGLGISGQLGLYWLFSS